VLSNRLREVLYPVLVMSIIGSLWFAGRAGEMEADIRLGLAAPQQWKAVRAQAEAEVDARAERAAALQVSAAH
jgi:hypothetical protein